MNANLKIKLFPGIFAIIALEFPRGTSSLLYVFNKKCFQCINNCRKLILQIVSDGSCLRLYSCKGVSPSSAFPGLGKLQPPEPAARMSFHSPFRMAKLPLMEWCTVASRMAMGMDGFNNNGRRL